MKKYLSRLIKNIKYANRSTIIGLIIGLFLGVGGTVSAAILISSDEVSYSGKDTSAANVKDALDELYNYSYNGGVITGVEGLSWEFEEVGVDTFTVPLDGMYNVQLWGAQGGGTDEYPGGKGAYTAGDIYLEKGEKLYIYIGGEGIKPTGGYNGGGNGYNNGYGGGGATDIRTIKGEWNNVESLASRIMVAAGGGGSSLHGGEWNSYGGPGGGLTGLLGPGGNSAIGSKGTVPTQVMAGRSNPSSSGENGKFGSGGKGASSYSNGSAGSGWYGGGGGALAGGLNSGGSSYISGHDGCIGVDVSGNPTGTSISHTKKYFINTKMVDGKGFEWTTFVNEEATGMPTYEGTEVMSGNSGNGYAKITFKVMKRDVNYNKNYNNIQKAWTFYHSDIMQTFEVNISGTYKVELWGASGGGNDTYSGGKGAYTSGEIYLTKGEKYYIYTGASGNNVYKGYNGGGEPYSSSYYGGGATDIRTVADTWNNVNSLRSRIMVAAGGSGASTHDTSTWWAYGASGGGLTGYLAAGGSNAISSSGTYPTQVIGGLGNASSPGGSGSFGIGGKGHSAHNNGGGGAGWYGGSGSSLAGGLNSSGSSYISGHDGCIAIDASGNHLGSSISYTGKYFKNTKMIDGKGYKWTTEADTKSSGMPMFDGSDIMDGNASDGFAKITRISTNEVVDYYSNADKIQKKWIFYPSSTLQPFQANKSGKYKIELWGASGGGSQTYAGGKGAYVSGEIHLTEGEKLYIYTGISGQVTSQAVAYNGGGKPNGSAYYGGGATDVRTIGNAWNNVESLRSRIMVAAGGSGASTHDTSTWWANGADAGGLTSYLGTGGTSATTYAGTIATQTSGGIGNKTSPGGTGSFGLGGNGYTTNGNAGGGSGWYGGAGSSHAGGLNSSGSSYISGHSGCIGVNQDGTAASNANSYTGKTFTNTKMVDGKGYEWTTKVGTTLKGNPTFDLRDTEIGHSGDGYARITFIE